MGIPALALVDIKSENSIATGTYAISVLYSRVTPAYPAVLPFSHSYSSLTLLNCRYITRNAPRDEEPLLFMAISQIMLSKSNVCVLAKGRVKSCCSL